MENTKVVSTERLEKWMARKKAKLSDELRTLKIKELEDELFHLRTLPLGKDKSSTTVEEIKNLIQNEKDFDLPFEVLQKILENTPIEKWESRLSKLNEKQAKLFKQNIMKKSKFETDSTDFVIGRINRNRIASGSVRQKMRRFDGDPEKGISGLIKKLSDPSDNGFITSNLRKEYQSRELDLCGFLDRSRWTDNQIHIMRRIVGEMKTIFELAGMQGIQIDPIFVGLHRLDSELKNCTKRDPKKRATAQNNLRIELFRIRKRSMKIERDNEIPSFKEYLTTGIWH